MQRFLKASVGGLILHIAIVLASMSAAAHAAEAMPGTVGASTQYASGWIDFAQPVDFSRGERLRFVIGGTATKILIRMLSKGQSRDGSDGLLGGVIDVPKTRVVELSLGENRAQVIQISVHGGPNPWGKFPMPGNGPATLQAIERLPPRK
jgi:hypothetical protein